MFPFILSVIILASPASAPKPLNLEETLQLMNSREFNEAVKKQMAKTKPAETKRRIKILDKSLKSK